MKAYTLLKRNLLICLLTFIASNGTYAQGNVCEAVIIDHGTSLDNSVSHKSQSNDLYFNDCENFLAVVNSYGIYWQYNDVQCIDPNANSDGHITHLPLLPGFQEVRNPDVAIVYDSRYQLNNVYYALVVYYNPNDLGYYFVVYEFDGTSLNLAGTPVLLKQLWNTPPTEICNIRIDANTNGDFVIVWDNDPDKSVETIVGFLDIGGAGPVLSVDAYDELQITTLPYDDANFPDVAISESNDLGYANVHYTMLLFEDKKWIVCTHEFDDLLMSNNVSMPNIKFTEENDELGIQIIRPRIAAPGLLDGHAFSDEFWSVVAQWYDHYNIESHIIGVTSRGVGNINKHFYTDNSDLFLIESGINITKNISHKNPSITYTTQNEEPHIQIAWTGGFEELLFTNQGTSDGTKFITSISLTLDIDGKTTLNGNVCYKIIPEDDIYEADFTALSGRHANSERDMLVSWTNLSGNKVFMKRFMSNNVEFKPSVVRETIKQSQDKVIKVYPNPSKGSANLNLINFKTNSVYALVVTDLSGRNILKTQGVPNNLENIFSKLSNNLKQGMYIIRVYDLNSRGSIEHTKFIKLK